MVKPNRLDLHMCIDYAYIELNPYGILGVKIKQLGCVFLILA